MLPAPAPAPVAAAPEAISPPPLVGAEAPVPPPPPPPPYAVAAAQPPPSPAPAPAPAPDLLALPPQFAPRAAPAPAPEPHGTEGYRGAAWGSSIDEFARLKAASPGAVSNELVLPAAGEPSTVSSDAAWSDALAVLLGVPVVSDALWLQTLPAQFSSVYVPADETRYVFFEGRLVAALVQVSAASYDPLRARLVKRYKARGSLAHKVLAREGHPGGTLVAEASANGTTRVYLCKFQYSAPGSGDLLTSARLLYFSDAEFQRIGQAVQKTAAALRKKRAPQPVDSTERDLNKLQ